MNHALGTHKQNGARPLRSHNPCTDVDELELMDTVHLWPLFGTLFTLGLYLYLLTVHFVLSPPLVRMVPQLSCMQLREDTQRQLRSSSERGQMSVYRTRYVLQMYTQRESQIFLW